MNVKTARAELTYPLHDRGDASEFVLVAHDFESALALDDGAE